MRTPISQEFVEIISGNNGLKRYLDSLSEDKPYTQRSWLYSGHKHSKYLSPAEVLTRWNAQLAVLRSGTDFEQNVYQFDLAQKAKFGPQGGHERVESILDDIVMPSFNPPKWSIAPSAFSSAAWKQAVKDCVRIFQKAGVHDLYPRSYERVVDDMRARDTLISNSGWPLFTRRNKPEVIQQALKDAHDGTWRQQPAILLFRRYNGKTRQVWMFPMACNIVEGSWFQPLTDAIMRSSLADTFFSPWKGFDAVRARVSDIYKNKSVTIAASDFSSTDAHFQMAASKEVLKVLKPLFKKQFSAALEESVLHMHQIPLIISSKDMLVGDHGVASGSNWTNFIETIYDMIFGRYVQIIVEQRTNGEIEVYALYAIGDDEAWAIRKISDAKGYADFIADFPALLEELGKSAGQQIKAEKTMCERDAVKSLQRYFQRGYTDPDSGEVRAVYSTIRALKSSIYPERDHYKDWDLDMFAARQFMILENCVDHPLFIEFVQFVCAGNPYLKTFARKTDKQLSRITRLARQIPGLNPTYNQEKRDSGLADFRSIRVAREF